MSAPAMAEQLDTHEDAVEAVIEQITHAQDAARRVDRDLVARRTAERIVDGLTTAAYPDTLAPAVAAVPDTLDVRVDRFLGAVVERVPAFRSITRGRALDALEAPNARAAADVIDHDLTACDPDDIRHLVDGVRAARLAVGVIDPPGVGEYARTVEQLNALPLRSVVRPDRGGAAEKYADGWSFTDGSRCLAVVPLPARVLEVGGEQ